MKSGTVKVGTELVWTPKFDKAWKWQVLPETIADGVPGYWPRPIHMLLSDLASGAFEMHLVDHWGTPEVPMSQRGKARIMLDLECLAGWWWLVASHPPTLK